MKILKFLAYGSFLVILINFALALYSSMNGAYNVGYVHRMVPFIFIFAASTCMCILFFIFKKIFSKSQRPD